jgi:pimeloyl-ACP methyl ester carboxylesterase
MDIDWREHQRFMRVDDRWVNVIELPAARSAPRARRLPMVFVHGLSGTWRNWLENLPHFAAAGHRVIAFDLPGFGASELPRETISISGYGRFVDTLLEQLGVGAAIVLGNSMGGFVGAELAIRTAARRAGARDAGARR